MNEIEQAVRLLGSCRAVAEICGVSTTAVQKWLKRGKLPRTEATGETSYAEKLALAHPRINKQRLLATVRASKAA